MNKTLFPAILLAGVLAVSVSAFLQAQGPARNNNATNAAPPSSGSDKTSVAVIDIKQIFETYAPFKTQMEGMAAEAKKYDEYVTGQKGELSKQAEKLRGLEPGSNEYRKLEEGLARTDTDLAVEFKRKQREFVERRSKIYFECYKRIEDVVRDFANKNGIDLVLRFDSAEMDESNYQSIYQGVNRGVVFQRNRDITKFIREELARTAPPTFSTGIAPQGGNGAGGGVRPNTTGQTGPRTGVINEPQKNANKLPTTKSR